MKTLILYNSKTGDVTFTQTITDVEDVEYDTIIADIPEDRVVARVENGKVVYEDPAEIIEKRERLDDLLNEASSIKKDLLAYEIGVINDGQ